MAAMAPLTLEQLERLPAVETHISKVYLDDRLVYKRKKPVDLGFLDFTTLERRAAACREEVRLNRRLAREVYLGVDAIEGSDGEIIDWVVVMRRLAENRRADLLLEAGRLGSAEIDGLAALLADFHRRARCDEETTRFGALEVIEQNVIENLSQTADAILSFLTPAELTEIETRQLEFLADHESAFRTRTEQGRVRDCHGDLRLEHVYYDDLEQTLDTRQESGSNDEAQERGSNIRVIDCIEFNERFRFSDVCADITFLAMDLTWHGAALLAERFLSQYSRASNDYDLYELIDFYESYRAFVRGKVALLTAEDPSISAATRQRAEAEARRFFLLALASERRSLQAPMVVAVGGLIASGKSTVANELAFRLGGAVVSADPTRKHLLGVEPEQPIHVPAFEGAYSSKMTEKTYREVLRRARVVLRSGRPVVIDASFRGAAERTAARHLARVEGVPFHFAECHAPRRVLVERLEERQQRTGVSDGRLEILDQFMARWEPVVELLSCEHMTVSTTIDLDETVGQIARHLGALPAALP